MIAWPRRDITVAAVLAIFGGIETTQAQLISANGRTASSREAAASTIPGIDISCNILTDDALEVQGTNTTNRSYNCNVTCNLEGSNYRL